MDNISELRPKESVIIDHGFLQQIYDAFGAAVAETWLRDMLSMLELQLVCLKVKRHIEAAPDVPHLLRAIEIISEHIGLVALSMVAHDAAICAKNEDNIALNAVLARLFRVAQTSNLEISHWERHKA